MLPTGDVKYGVVSVGFSFGLVSPVEGIFVEYVCSKVVEEEGEEEEGEFEAP